MAVGVNEVQASREAGRIIKNDGGRLGWSHDDGNLLGRCRAEF